MSELGTYRGSISMNSAFVVVMTSLSSTRLRLATIASYWSVVKAGSGAATVKLPVSRCPAA